MKSKEEIVNEWHATIEEGSDKFLDFGEGLNINEFAEEDGERVVWLEDGVHYIAHGERIGEFDGEKEKEIIETLAECGVDFEESSREWICVDDYEGTGFHLGDTKTAKGWQEWALGMPDIEDSEDRDKFARMPPLEAMELVADLWQIDLEPFDKNNKEHIEMRAEYERK